MPDQSSSMAPDTQNIKSEPSPFTAPHVELPKGGGAIRGIGEKFSTNSANGTGSLTVPLRFESRPLRLWTPVIFVPRLRIGQWHFWNRLESALIKYPAQDR